MTVPSTLLDDLTDFQRWAKTAPRFTLLDYAMCVLTPDAFYAVLEVLNPALLVHDGHHFIASRFSTEAYEQWRTRLASPREIQRVMNHLHVSSLFQNGQLTDRVATAAVRAIAETWSLRFAELGLAGEAYGESASDAEVTLVKRS